VAGNWMLASAIRNAVIRNPNFIAYAIPDAAGVP
jgi:hypothetical protein